MVTLATTLSCLGKSGGRSVRRGPHTNRSVSSAAATAARHPRAGNVPGGGGRAAWDRPQPGRPPQNGLLRATATRPPTATASPPPRHASLLAAARRGAAGGGRGAGGTVPGAPSAKRGQRSAAPSAQERGQTLGQSQSRRGTAAGGEGGLHSMPPSREAGGRLRFSPSQVRGARFSPAAVCVCGEGGYASPSARGETKSFSRRAWSRAAPSRSPIPFSPLELSISFPASLLLPRTVFPSPETPGLGGRAQRARGHPASRQQLSPCGRARRAPSSTARRRGPAPPPGGAEVPAARTPSARREGVSRRSPLLSSPPLLCSPTPPGPPLRKPRLKSHRSAVWLPPQFFCSPWTRSS